MGEINLVSLLPSALTLFSYKNGPDFLASFGKLHACIITVSKSNTIPERIFTKADINFVKSLNDRVFRNASKQFVAEGSKSVLEMISSGLKLERIFALETWFKTNYSLIAGKCEPTLISEKELVRMSSLKSTRQVLGVFQMPQFRFEPTQLRGLTLVLDGLQDPGNLGTLIRLADWYGLENILCSDTCVDCFNPKTVQATMASIGRVKIHYGNLPQMILACDLPLFAAVMDDTPGRNITFQQNMLLVIGNEGQGISEEILKLNHQGITIEKYGEAESLNAAMAGAILIDRYFGQFA